MSLDGYPDNQEGGSDMASARPRLAQRRKTLGYTQESLATALGIERTTVVRWERGETQPQAWQWPRLATILRITDSALQEMFAQDPQTVISCHVSDDNDHDGLGLDTVQEIMHRSRHTNRSVVDVAKLVFLERTVETAIRENERRAPYDLAPKVRDTRRWVDELLIDCFHPGQRERLYTAAVRLSGLLGALALDLGRWEPARAYALEAFELSAFLGIANLQA